MADVTLKALRLSGRNIIPDYAAQDLETQVVGNAIPFTYDFQSGFVLFSNDFITPNPITLNVFDGIDLESLNLGAITVIPADLPPATEVHFLNGTVAIRVFSYASDDLEIYPVGNIAQLNGAFSGGADTTLGVGNIRPYG